MGVNSGPNRPYGARSGWHSHCGNRKGVGMRNKRLVLFTLCVLLVTIAMFVGGLPWGNIAVR